MSVHTQYSHFIYGKGLIKSYVIIWHVTYFIGIHNPKVDAFVVKKRRMNVSTPSDGDLVAIHLDAPL